MTSFWDGRPVLVTGGAGFIGSHLVEALLEAGASVRVLDAYNPESLAWHLQGLASDKLEIHLGDVADVHFTRRLTAGIDTVFHLAALIGIPYSYVAPSHYVRTNVEGTLAVLEAARDENVRRVVHTSTSEVYGTAQYTPIDESHPLVAQSPYAATKVAADQLAGSYFRSFDVPVVTLRPFNTYGPRQSMRAILPSLMAQALFADRVEVGALDPVRDMNFVSDTVAGFLGAGSASNVEGEVFNVGSGSGRTIGELLSMVLEVAGTEKPVNEVPDRIRPPKSEVGTLICQHARATEAFGYKPQVSLEEGLRRLREHVLAHGADDPNRYRI